MNTFYLPLDALPRIVVASRFLLADNGFSTIHQGRTHALQLHDYEGEMILAGRRIRLAPGDVTLSPARMPSSYHIETPGYHWCIHFESTAQTRERAPIALHQPSCEALRERFAHVCALYSTASDPIASAAARLAVQELLLNLARLNAPLPTDDAPARAAAYIDRHFDQPIGMREIASAAERSPAYLARIFRKRFGITIPHRLLQRRARHAQFLLESTDLPIWRIAERCGIPDPQHFNKTMRKILGASPSSIRARTVAARRTGPMIDPDR